MSSDADDLVATMSDAQRAQYREWTEWRNDANPNILLDAVLAWWRIARDTPREPGDSFAMRPGEGYLSIAAAEALLARVDSTRPEALSEFGIACFILGLDEARQWINANVSEP